MNRIHNLSSVTLYEKWKGIKITLHKRKHGSGRFFERHPDIQEMIEEYFPQS